MMTVERKVAEKPEGRNGPRTAGDREAKLCDVLFVSDDNLLGDSVDAAAHRQLAAALAEMGARCEAVGRFVVSAETETELDPWLSARQWALDKSADDEAETGAGVL